MANPAPCDLDAERSLLGALATDVAVARPTLNGTTSAAFYKPAHAHIFDAICALDDAGLYVDVGVIHDRLRGDGLLDSCGGVPGVLDAVRLVNAPPPEAAGQYAEILGELARQRCLLAAAGEAILAIEHDHDPDAAVRRMAHAVNHDRAGPSRLAGVQMVEWAELWSRERPASDYALDPVAPRGKATNVYATRGTGKSELLLFGAAARATGRACLNSPAGDPLSVVYLDMEMGDDDLVDRLTELGYGPADDLSNLHYACLPSLPPMNTLEGGAAVLDIVRTYAADMVIVDTLARVGDGEENSNDTWIGLATHTILRLKAEHVTSVWLGHAGKDIAKGERGGSAKGDAVDVIWKQERGEGGSVRLTNEKRRANWVPERVDLRRTERAGTVTYEMGGDAWPDGTNVVVAELDHLKAPLDMSRRAAAALLKEHGAGARNDVVGAALRWRRQRPAGSEGDF